MPYVERTDQEILDAFEETLQRYPELADLPTPWGVSVGELIQQAKEDRFLFASITEKFDDFRETCRLLDVDPVKFILGDLDPPDDSGPRGPIGFRPL